MPGKPSILSTTSVQITTMAYVTVGRTKEIKAVFANSKTRVLKGICKFGGWYSGELKYAVAASKKSKTGSGKSVIKDEIKAMKHL